MSHDSSPEAIQAVVIGASAGAVEALLQILPELPVNYPLPILLVVHLPADRESTLAGLLDSRSWVTVKEAEDKEPLRAGTVYLAPPNYHLLVEPEQILALSSDEAVNFSRPSIDVLFESAADAFGNGLVGVILTGANSDGSVGLQAVHAAGGVAIVQNPQDAAADVMPRAALAACPQASMLSIAEIVHALKFKFPGAES
jgi:two-component system chemotaxis response regulator CheB